MLLLATMQHMCTAILLPGLANHGVKQQKSQSWVMNPGFRAEADRLLLSCMSVQLRWTNPQYAIIHRRAHNACMQQLCTTLAFLMLKGEKHSYKGGGLSPASSDSVHTPCMFIAGEPLTGGNQHLGKALLLLNFHVMQDLV